MRAFVAVTPPAEVVDALWAWTADLREDTPGLRWSRPEQWHLTLAFLGEVPEEGVDALAERLGRAARRNPPMTLSLGGGGRFGQRVLWTRVRGDRDGLRALAGSVQAAARRCRLPVDDRQYRPHLTLARAAAAVDLRPLVERLADYDGEPWTARALHLVRSRLGAGPGGTARHEPVRGWPLGRANSTSTVDTA